MNALATELQNENMKVFFFFFFTGVDSQSGENLGVFFFFFPSSDQT